MIMLSKSSRKKDIGGIFIGFAVLMFGMETMTDAMSEINLDILTVLRNPIVGVLAGILGWLLLPVLLPELPLTSLMSI